jgi:hypothetical protein
MTVPLSEATQVGVGSTAVEAAAGVVLFGGLVLTALWLRALYA